MVATNKTDPEPTTSLPNFASLQLDPETKNLVIHDDSGAQKIRQIRELLWQCEQDQQQ